MSLRRPVFRVLFQQYIFLLLILVILILSSFFPWIGTQEGKFQQFWFYREVGIDWRRAEISLQVEVKQCILTTSGSEPALNCRNSSKGTFINSS